MHAQNPKPKTLALFDFDGTLYPHDSFTGFIFYALPKMHIIKRGISILPWIIGYYLKLYPAHKMRPKLYSAMFRNTHFTEIDNLAESYAKKLIAHLDPALFEQLIKHQQCDHEIILVSATIDLYLNKVATQLGIQVICSQVEIIDDQLSGAYLTADCSQQHKKQRVLNDYPVDQYPLIYAYGNSYEDAAMLSLAQHAFMVGTDTQLPKLQSFHPCKLKNHFNRSGFL